MLDRLSVLEPEDLEADLACREVVLRVAEEEVAVLEGSNDVHPRRSLRQPLEENRQSLAALVGLGVVLNVLRFINDGDGARITGLDALEKRPDLIFLRTRHG